jgi:hypothetical protein
LKYASIMLVPSLVLACTGEFGDPSAPVAPPGSPSAAPEGGSSSPLVDASSSAEEADTASASDPADSSSDSPSGAPADDAGPSGTPAATDGGAFCETTMDSYGYTQCACMQGPAAVSHPVAACAGYDCCVQYGPDSGLASGFGNPAISSDLCACYSSADIAATLGASVSCQDFANDGNTMIVSSCP